MKIKAVTLGRTKNLGNFESARAEVTIELEPGETEDEAFEVARGIVAKQLKMNPRDRA